MTRSRRSESTWSGCVVERALRRRREARLCRAFLLILSFVNLSSFTPPALASNCAGTSVGSIPLEDLGPGIYQGFPGGLYPTGANARPPLHEINADLLARLVLLDPNGVTSASGRIVLLSIGMSNTTQEFSRFVQLANADPNRNQAVRVVDGAQG